MPLQLNEIDTANVTPVQSPPSDYDLSSNSISLPQINSIELPPQMVINENELSTENKPKEIEKKEEEEEEIQNTPNTIENNDNQHIISLETTSKSKNEMKQKRLERFKGETSNQITTDDIIKIYNKEILTECLTKFNQNLLNKIDTLYKHTPKEVIEGLKKKFGEENINNFFKKYL